LGHFVSLLASNIACFFSSRLIHICDHGLKMQMFICVCQMFYIYVIPTMKETWGKRVCAYEGSLREWRKSYVWKLTSAPSYEYVSYVKVKTLKDMKICCSTISKWKKDKHLHFEAMIEWG
jgi:hypothetical protein